jgi:hypothetical protein
MTEFRKPSNGWLCFFSLVWIVLGAGSAIYFAFKGNYLGAGVMGVFSLAAAGLWVQSRLAAWVLILFACAGILHVLLNLGSIRLLRIATRLCWAGYSIFLLIEYLKENQSTSDGSGSADSAG